MNDDLFTPTVSTVAGDRSRPWRVDSLIYPSFFGGPLAGTVLGLINGRRLGVGARAMVAVAAAGLVAMVVRSVVDRLVDAGSAYRMVVGLAGVAVWGVIWATQRRRFRGFQLTGGEPARLIWPGLAVAVGGFLLEGYIGMVAMSIVEG